MFYCIIDPAFDRRIIYNDFRSNPYLHFDAGLVPRAPGDLLGELYCLLYYLLLLLDLYYYYYADIMIDCCAHSLGYRDYNLC